MTVPYRDEATGGAERGGDELSPFTFAAALGGEPTCTCMA
jgi:hypothetical protein